MTQTVEIRPTGLEELADAVRVLKSEIEGLRDDLRPDQLPETAL